MKLALVLTAAIAGALAAGAPAVAHPTAAACVPKTIKVNGGPAAVNCGPAVVKLVVAGKTYTFTSGHCQSGAPETLNLYMGTAVSSDAKGNAGLPFFTLSIVKKTGFADAHFGRRHVLLTSVVTVARKKTGTFVGKLASPKISGSWDCHGAPTRT